jgi:hypothetical protein
MPQAAGRRIDVRLDRAELDREVVAEEPFRGRRPRRSAPGRRDSKPNPF